MKLLIGGKNRNIYMRKDGSAYYKSGGENVDVTYMFKKNGGGLKKQYIGGVQDNLGKVEKNKRSSKCVKQILGGAGSTSISFDQITINSEQIMDAGSYKTETGILQLKQICCLALYGLSAAMNDLLIPNLDIPSELEKDRIKVAVGLNLDKFVNYLDKATKKTYTDKLTPIIDEPDDSKKKSLFLSNVINDTAVRPEIDRLGFKHLNPETDFSVEAKCVYVTRAYILNKILQCFEGTDGGTFIADTTGLAPHSDGVHLYLNDTKKQYIDPNTGKFNNAITVEEIAAVFNNIYKTSQLTKQTVGDSAKNLHTVLFLEEQIGAPPAPAPAEAEA